MKFRLSAHPGIVTVVTSPSHLLNLGPGLAGLGILSPIPLWVVRIYSPRNKKNVTPNAMIANAQKAGECRT
jgi:hypothetical protein